MPQQKKNEKMPSIEVLFYSASNVYQFQVKSRKGELIAQGRGYTNIRDAKKAIDSLADAMWEYESGRIEIRDMLFPSKKKKTPKKEEPNVNQEKNS
jgi:uncharacterized protein YegP (UPF0339 family)